MKENPKFIMVKSLTGYHIINLSLIKSVSPMKDSGNNKSSIKIIGENELDFYSTDDQETIFNKIKEASL